MPSAKRRSETLGRTVALCLMLILATPSLAYLISIDAGAIPVIVEDGVYSQQVASSYGASYHVATASEIERMMQEIGVRAAGEEGSATGLAPPTEAGWKSLAGKLLVLDSLPSLTLASSFDLSTDPCFPIVGDQANQGSCAAWAATYYCYGYIEAKDNGWTDAKTGNTAHLMSPAWTYNKVNEGDDEEGSWMTQNMQVICDWGTASMSTMPYNDDDVLSWGSAAAFREAALHRGLATVAMSCNGTDWTVDQLKTLVALGTPVTFAINANNVFYNALLDNYIVSSSEYSSTNMNHAQTIVGYDDLVSEGGEVGAFKVVNSWGLSGSDNTDGGYYWWTYDALKKLLNMVGMEAGMCYIEDRADYVPSLIGVWHFNAAPSRTGDITVGIGSSSGDERTLYFEHDIESSAHRMPSFMCIDLTDYEAEYFAGETTFRLEIGTTSVTGTISSFRVERYEGGYDPGKADQISPQSISVPRVTPGTVTSTLPLDATVGYDEALDTSSLSYSSSSISQWVGIDHLSYYEGDALESGDTADSGSSVLTVTLDGPATYAFYWRVSSEANKDLLRLTIDGGTIATISGSTSWAQRTFDLSVGSHSVSWTYSKDSFGSVGEDAGYVDRLTEPDTSPPLTAIELTGTHGLNDWFVSSVNVSLTASDDRGGVSVTYYNLNGGAWTEYAAPFSITADGVHVLSYYSIDLSSNFEPVKQSTVKIDDGAPETNLAVEGDAGLGGWFTSPVSVTLTASDDQSGLYATCASLDGEAWHTVSGAFTVEGEGLHNLRYYSVDVAGNVEAEWEVSIGIDGSTPTSSATLTGVEGTSGWYRSQVTVVLEAEDGASGIKNVSYRIDGGTWMEYHQPVTISTEGKHILEYRSEDAAGNIEMTDSIDIWIDSTQPTLTAPTMNTDHSIDGSVTIAWNSSDACSGLVVTILFVDGMSYGPATSNDGVVVVTGLSDGVHNITVVSMDVAGNRAESYGAVAVDTNPFSSSGPYGPWIDIVIIAALCAVVLFLLVRKKLK